MEGFVKETAGGVIITVRVKPRSKKDAVEGVSPDGSLIVRLTAPPVDDKANRSLISFLASKLSLPKSSLQILTGEKSRNKAVRAEGVSAEEAGTLLLKS